MTPAPSLEERLALALIPLEDAITTLFERDLVEPFKLHDTPGFMQLRPLTKSVMWPFSPYARPPIVSNELMVPPIALGSLRLHHDPVIYEAESHAYHLLSEKRKGELIGEAELGLLNGETPDDIYLPDYTPDEQHFLRLAMRQLDSPTQHLLQTEPLLRSTLLSFFADPATPFRLRKQFHYALGPHKFCIPLDEQSRKHSKDHFLTIPALCAIQMLGTGGIAWDAKYLDRQFMEYSHLLPLWTRLSPNPFYWAGGNAHKAQSITRDNLAAYGLINRMKLSPIALSTMRDMAKLLQPYFPSGLEQVERGIAQAKQYVDATEAMQEDLFQVKAFLREKKEGSFPDLDLESLVERAEKTRQRPFPLTQSEARAGDIFLNLMNSLDTVAFMSDAVINMPNQGHDPALDHPHYEVLSPLFKAEKEHAWWYFSGAENTYPYMLSEINNRSSHLFGVVHYIFHKLGAGVHAGEHVLLTNPLEKIIRDGKENAAKLAKLEETLVKYGASFAKWFVKHDYVGRLESLSNKHQQSVLPANGVASFLHHHRFMLGAFLFTKGAKNLTRGAHENVYWLAIRDAWNTLFSFNPLRYAEFALNLLHGGDDRIHKLHGKHFMYDSTIDAARDAMNVGTNTLSGNFNEHDYLRTLHQLAMRQRQQPGNVFISFAAGYMQYCVGEHRDARGVLYQDKHVLEDAEYNLRDVIGFIKDAGGELNDLSHDDKKVVLEQLLPAAHYYLANLSHLRGNSDYHKKFADAYAEARTVLKVSRHDVEGVDRKIPRAELVARHTDLTSKSFSDLFHHMRLAPFDFVSRGEYLCALSSIHDYSRFFNRELRRYYDDVNALRNVLVPEDIGAALAASRLLGDVDDAYAMPEGLRLWFEKDRHEEYATAQKHAQLYTSRYECALESPRNL